MNRDTLRALINADGLAKASLADPPTMKTKCIISDLANLTTWAPNPLPAAIFLLESSKAFRPVFLYMSFVITGLYNPADRVMLIESVEEMGREVLKQNSERTVLIWARPVISGALVNSKSSSSQLSLNVYISHLRAPVVKVPEGLLTTTKWVDVFEEATRVAITA